MRGAIRSGGARGPSRKLAGASLISSALIFPEIHWVLSGCHPPPAARTTRFRAKHRVLSGCPPRSAQCGFAKKMRFCQVVTSDPCNAVSRKTSGSLGVWAVEHFCANCEKRTGDLKVGYCVVRSSRGRSAVLAKPFEGSFPLDAPQAICIALILRRFSAKQTSLNSACAFCKPRMLNCRKPSTLLIQPLGGSAIHLRLR